MDSHPALSKAGFPYKAALAGTSILSLVLAGVLVLFVAHPSYPVQLHYAFTPESSALRPETAKEGVDREDSGTLDEWLVRTWAQERFKTHPVGIETVDDTETFTVSRFKLDNGRYVQVCTRHPLEETVRRVSY